MDRPERRRWDAGNSVFGSDRVKIDNSLPAGGRTSGYHVRRFGTFRRRKVQPVFGVIALLQRRQRRERMARRVAGRRRLEHRAGLARIGIDSQKQKFGGHRAEIDHAIREAPPADRPPRRASRSTASAAVARLPAGTPGRSLRRSSLSIGSSVTTQFCTTVAETRPTTRSPSAPCRVEIEASLEPRQRREARGLGDGRRASPSSATRSSCRPVSGMSATATGTLQGRLGRWLVSGSLAHRSRHRLRIGKIKLRARQRTAAPARSSRRLASRI